MAISLGRREHDVMSVLWTRGPSTVSEVRESLGAPLAYTTVLTILRNLEAKGAVARTEEGRAHRYAPLVQRDVARAGALQRLLDRFFAGQPELLLTHLVDADELGEAGLDALARTIEARRRQRAGSEGES